MGLCLGLISGTSMDAVDTVLAECGADTARLLASHSHPIPTELRQQLQQITDSGGTASIAAYQALDQRLGALFAEAALALMSGNNIAVEDISAIGLHGQTVLHQPDAPQPYTLQLGNPQQLAWSTGITTVANFRDMDMIAGGQGAPLAPLLHRQLFHSQEELRGVLNLGGIANITLLYPDGRVSGWDTGPANCLLDSWAQQQLGQSYDAGGHWAAQGEVIDALVQAWLQDPYFAKTPPKSTGTEYFHSNWAQQHIALEQYSPASVQASLTQLSVESIAANLPPQLQRLLICGGGVHNTNLITRLQQRLPQVVIESTAAYGVAPDWVEGLLFAWLAWRRVHGISTDTGPITGASQPVLLGDIIQVQ